MSIDITEGNFPASCLVNSYLSFKPSSLSPSLIFQMALSFVFPLYQGHSFVVIFILGFLQSPLLDREHFERGIVLFILTFPSPSLPPYCCLVQDLA